MLIKRLIVTGSGAAFGAIAYTEKWRRTRLVDALTSDLSQSKSAIVAQPSSLSKSLIASGLIGVGALIGGGLWLATAHGLTPLVMTNQLIAFLQAHQYGPAIYTLLYTIRPLVLFPAALMIVAAGLLYGPIWGTIYAIMGAAGSAIFVYGLGRLFGQSMLSGQQNNTKIAQYTTLYTDWMKNNPFESTLIMHLLILHYDLVSALAGILEIDWKAFLAGTILGSLPATMAFVLFGSSIQGSAIHALPHINLTTLAAGGVVFVGSLALARYLKSAKSAPTHSPMAQFAS